jgi:hypothetical protein
MPHRQETTDCPAIERSQPPAPTGKPSFWWARDNAPWLRKADLGTLMREGEAMIAAMTAPQK